MTRLYMVPLLLFCSAHALVPSAKAHAPDVVLSGFGTATIDGIHNAGEWDAAGCAAIEIDLPEPREGEQTSGEVCAMNDELNLYLLIRFEMDPRFPSWISTMFFFDDEHTGEVDQGDDALLLAPDFVGFEDSFANIEPPCPSGQICYTRDVLAGGTDDGAGAAANDGQFAVFEFSHPLDSGDDFDFSLSAGEVVGFAAWVRIATDVEGSERFETTVFPAEDRSGFGDILIAFPHLQAVSVVLGPGSSNVINPRSRGRFWAAILSTDFFDASTVDADTVRFGATGTEAAPLQMRLQDVDRDGRRDLLLQFNTQDTGITCGAVAAVLRGQTLDGSTIEGSTSLVTVGCER